jgi:hypothetical protein
VLDAPNQPATLVVFRALVCSVPIALFETEENVPRADASKSVPLVEHPAEPGHAVVTPPDPSAAKAFQHGSPDAACAPFVVPSIQAELAEAME